jgi:predicted SAM-dependent methyltransferase
MSPKQLLKSRIDRVRFPLRLLRDVRFEARLTFVRARGRVSPNLRRRARELRAMKGVKLHFGCGSRILPGWINIDCSRQIESVDYICDLRQPLPLCDGSCRLIFTEHVLDEFDPQFLPVIARELFRLLEAEGTIRIVVLDLERLIDVYLRNDFEWRLKEFPDCRTRGELLNTLFHDHYFRRLVFDYESIAQLLRDAGFSCIRQSSHQGSQIEELRQDTGGPTRISTNLYIEASKAEDRFREPRR